MGDILTLLVAWFVFVWLVCEPRKALNSPSMDFERKRFNRSVVLLPYVERRGIIRLVDLARFILMQ